MSKKVYEIITEKICERIETAIKNGEPLPWKKPWVWLHTARNYLGNEYRGINALLLEGGEYITWTQICDLQKHNRDIKLKKGCKKEMVVYYNFKECEVEAVKDGKKVVEKHNIPYLRYYNVYNIKYVEGIESRIKEVSYEHQPIEKAEQIVKRYLDAEKIKLRHIKGDKASYSPSSDTITLPLMEQFERLEEYYSTLFHEIGHSTMSRVGRSTKGYFGDEEYSKEELVAEIVSSMLLAHCGINTPTSDKNNIAYMRSWLRALKDNKTWIVSSCGKAQTAVDYILES